PEGFRLDQRLEWQLYYAASIKPVVARTDWIFTVSEWSRRDIARHMRYPLERISVVYNWLEEHYAPATPEHVADVRRRYKLPERFVFTLGSEYRYKNTEGLLRAFAGLVERHPDVQLVLKIGQPQQFMPLIRSLGLEDRVTILGFVADADLPAVYTAATVFAFPSFYEGFGLPPLEAMLCGAPVVASRSSSIPEVVGTAALTFDPADTREFCQQLDRALGDAALRERMRSDGLVQARTFSVTRGIQETLAVYRQVLGVRTYAPRPFAPTRDPIGAPR
ncbi:MAG TPA: glycosyltransferase family 1 protein, partial [Stenomitos sp.]